MTPRVCEKHGQYCPTGVCRWCTPGENLIMGAIEALAQADGSVHVHIHTMDADMVRAILDSADFKLAVRTGKGGS